MRLHRQNLTPLQKTNIANFSAWLLAIGDGRLGTPDVDSSPDCKLIEIPTMYMINSKDNSLLELIRFVYDTNTLAYPNAETLSGKAIGNAIEATADITKERHFNSIINIGSTYTVDKYIAIPSRTYMPVVSHRTSLRMGNQTTFAPLLKESLPMYYYAFATYEDLSTRMEFPRLLTDYIGRIQNILPDTVRAKRRLRKLMIQDTQANNIEITLWGEKADVIGHDISPGNILAITSALVTEFKGVLQLESTNATAIAVNPAIPELQMYLDSKIDSHVLQQLLIYQQPEPGFMSTAQKVAAQTRLIRRKPHLYVRITGYSPIQYSCNDRVVKCELQRHDYDTRSQKFQNLTFTDPKCDWSKKTSTR
ncbi:hypothetical protein E3N88_29967 [Mikania micrantha]|uniref:Replication protein A OB domain-containing protein n=1 Tax=Mikania micrantha TaxID=192012 RepID=A0A5N6MN62_9ASTR|nr:hypothetical protein E3N88_29967 [Mikania micrantha]